jgi:UDP-glucose-4-epimerase GalE
VINKEHILVTGGAGYIGSHACKALADASYMPVAYDNLVYGHREAVRWGPFVEGDLADRQRLLQTIREYEISAVLHFAAFAYVGESIRQPRMYFHNNLVNTLTLLDCMLDAGVGRIVFSSSCATYGTPEKIPITEDTPQLPVNPYGETKLMIERVMRWYNHAYGLQYVALRYFNAAGADPDREIGEMHDPETHLIPLILDVAIGRLPRIDIYGTDYPTPDGTAIRDYIHVQDLADAHVRAIDHLRQGGRSIALNLGTGQGYTVREVIAAAKCVTGSEIPEHATARRAGDPPVLVADAKLAREVLGWEPKLSDPETILRTAWNWHQRLRVHRHP